VNPVSSEPAAEANLAQRPDVGGAPLWVLVLQVILLVVMIAVRFAEPVGDGDLFWQMAYGKYMLENHTLIPDHTIYSWTPADNPMIYCSWTAEIALYLMHQWGGLPLLFAFRYAVIGFTVLLAFLYARQVGWHRRAEFWLAATWMVITSYVGTILKPELFSFGLLSLLSFLVFRFRLAAFRGEPFARYLVGVVLTVAFWANTHGVFFPVMIVFAFYALGEVMNWFVSPALSLPAPARRPFLLALAGCAAAMFATPYGHNYMIQLFAETFGILLKSQSAGDAAAYQSLAAHLPIWRALPFHFQEYLPLGALLGVSVCVWLALFGPPRGRVDCSYLLMNGVLLYFYMYSLRSTFYWPPCFLYSTLFLLNFVRERGREGVPSEGRDEEGEGGEWPDLIFVFLNLAFLVVFFANIASLATLVLSAEQGAYAFTVGGVLVQVTVAALYLLARRQPGRPHRLFVPRPWLAVLVVVLQIATVGRTCKEAMYQPYSSSWFGFGITYWNPVDEVEFIKKYHPDIQGVINDYDSGGYLLWELFPKTKVMIDPRSFPYRKFWADYIEYERGKIGLEFLDRFPGKKPDVSVVSLKNTQLYRTYLRSKDWVPGWLGTAYIIFVRKGFQYPPDAAKFMPGRFETLRNSQKAFQIFQFGIDSQFYNISWEILDVMKRKFNSAPDDQVLTANCEAFKECMLAIEAKDYETARVAQEKCWRLGRLYNPGLLIGLYKLQLARLQRQGKTAQSPEIVEILTKAERLQKGLPPP
jgi:hypothetical protein